MKITIKKARLLKDDAGFAFDTEGKDDAGGTFVETNKPIKAPIHDDLKLAWKKLHIHYAILSARVNAKSVKNIDEPDEVLVEPYHVNVIHFNGSEDDPGFQISGYAVLDGLAYPQTTPFRRFEEADGKGYRYMTEFKALCERLKAELLGFYDGSKRGAEKQQKLDFEPKPGKTTVKVLPEEKKLFKEQPTPESVAGDLVNEVNSGIEDAQVVEETPEKKKPGRKRVAQSPDAKSGIVEEPVNE